MYIKMVNNYELKNIKLIAMIFKVTYRLENSCEYFDISSC